MASNLQSSISRIQNDETPGLNVPGRTARFKDAEVFESYEYGTEVAHLST